MTSTNTTRLSQREALASGSVAGFGAAAAASDATGSTLDLTDSTETLFAVARLTGNLDPLRHRLDWFDGSVNGVAPDGHVIPFAAVRGTMETSLTALELEQGWHRRRIFSGAYFDHETDELLKHLVNPFTGERITVPPFRVHLDGVLNGTNGLALRHQGDQVFLEETEIIPFGGVKATSITSRVANLGDLYDLSLTAVPELGAWTMASPWPDWLGMDGVPGYCLIQCKRGGGIDSDLQDAV